MADVRALFRGDRDAVWFLIASAIYRDGLTAVFTFGAVLAVSVYGLAPTASSSSGSRPTWWRRPAPSRAGRGPIGPKPVIMTSLVGLILAATILLFAPGPPCSGSSACC